MSRLSLHGLSRTLRSRALKRGALALGLAAALSVAGAHAAARARAVASESRLSSAVERLDELTFSPLADDRGRAAIAWGYTERLRLGLEPPFRLIEMASRDPRLTHDERGTVALALLSLVTRGISHAVEPAALDGIGPFGGTRVDGERHLTLIEQAIGSASDPRAAELGVRFAYQLAATERIVDVVGPLLATQAAALIADRELARREALSLVRSSRQDPIIEIRERRARRAFYVERPVLLGSTHRVEDEAVEVGAALLEALRLMPRQQVLVASSEPTDTARSDLAPELYRSGAAAPPSGALAVTVQRYLPLIRARARRTDIAALARAHNSEMLVGSIPLASDDRSQQRSMGRMLLAAAVAMRSSSQERIWFPGDSVASARDVAQATGVADIVFESDIPAAWRPYYVAMFGDAVRDLRRVLPGLRIDALQVRFRMTQPADSALAMHDPRTRTLHLPVFTSAGTITHELAHDLDRQSAMRQGHAGYRSDYVTRSATPVGQTSRLAASLRALTEELSDVPAGAGKLERPAEIFATRVDWFVAQALAEDGITSGFLSAVQDELLTGHVVHPERLRSASRSRSLLTALEEMTLLAPFGWRQQEPSVHTLLRWSLSGPLDADMAQEIVTGERALWAPPQLIGARGCDDEESARVRLIRLAAESRARGWIRQRAHWSSPGKRSPWAQAALGQGPWSPEPTAAGISALRDHILTGLAGIDQLSVGLGTYAAPLAANARCGG